jgi:hypothetical protein
VDHQIDRGPSIDSQAGRGAPISLAGTATRRPEDLLDDKPCPVSGQFAIRQTPRWRSGRETEDAARDAAADRAGNKLGRRRPGLEVHA